MNPSYFSPPSIPREPAPGSIGPTVETYLDRPSVRARRKKGPTEGKCSPVQTVDGTRKWPSVAAAARSLGVTFQQLHYAIRRGQVIAGVEVIYRDGGGK